MVYFKCLRCGYESLRKENFIRHLKRKYSCSPKLEDVPVGEIFRKYFGYKSQVESTAWMEFVEKMNPNESKRIQMNPNESLIFPPSKTSRPKKFGCIGCKKKFTTNSNMRKHERKCPKKKYLDRLEYLDQQAEVQEHEMRLVKTQNKSLINIGNNNNTPQTITRKLTTIT